MRRKALTSIVAVAVPRPSLRLLLLVGVFIVALASPANAAEVEKIAGGLDNPRHQPSAVTTSTWLRPGVAAPGRASRGLKEVLYVSVRRAR